MSLAFLYILLFTSLCVCFVKKKILTPVFFYNGVWLFFLLLYSLKMSHIQQDLSDRTVLIIWLAIASFDITCLVVSSVNIVAKYNYHWAFRSSRESRNKYARNLVIFVIVLEGIYSKGYPLIFALMGKASRYREFGIHSLHGAICGLIACLGAGSLFQKRNKDKWIYIGIGLLLLNRQLLLTIIVEGVLYVLFKGTANYKSVKRFVKRIPHKGLLVFAGCLALLLFGYFGNLRSGRNMMRNIFLPREEYMKLPTWIMWLYSYMTFSISNFNNLVSMTDGGVNYGASMLNFFLPSALKNAMGICVNYNPIYRVSSAFTVSTYLPYIYLDFGIFGIIIFNIVIGIITELSYKKLSKCNDLKCLFYSICIHNIIFMLFENMFIYLPIAIQFVYLPFLYSESRVMKNEKNVICECN